MHSLASRPPLCISSPLLRNHFATRLSRLSFFSSSNQTPGGSSVSAVKGRHFSWSSKSRSLQVAPVLNSIAPPKLTAPPSSPGLFFHTTTTTKSSTASSSFSRIMAETQAHDIDQLAGKVQGLSLDALAERYPNSYPRENPLDLWRAHISNVLGDISGVEKDIIYRAIAWTSGLDKGDFMIAVPALRVKGAKPDALATEWISKACTCSAGHTPSLEVSLLTKFNASGPRMTPWSRRLLPTGLSLPSSSNLMS